MILFRKLLRQQIRAVQQGKQPRNTKAGNGKAIPTYLRNTSVVTPPAATPAADRKLWRQVARQVAEEAIKDSTSRWKKSITLTPYKGTKT